MDGRRIHGAELLTLVVLTSCNLGCSAIWKQVPASAPRASKVSLDASWCLENPSKEVVARFTDERQKHVADVMSNRRKGVIGISLDDALHGNSELSDQSDAVCVDTSSADDSSTVSKAQQVHSANEINALPPAESGSGGLMLKVKGGTKYVR